MTGSQQVSPPTKGLTTAMWPSSNQNAQDRPILTSLGGWFPIASSKGNNYLLIVYDYNSNGILAQPMWTRTGPCILEAYKVLHERLVAAGLRPQLQRLDNEASQSLKQIMTSEGIDYQLVPPGVHRRNAAERAIRTGPSRTTSLLVSAALTRTSLFICGINLSLKLSSRSTC